MVVGRTVLVDWVLCADVIRRLVDINLPSPLEAEAVAAEGVHDDHAGRRRPVERTRPAHNDAHHPSEVWKTPAGQRGGVADGNCELLAQPEMKPRSVLVSPRPWSQTKSGSAGASSATASGGTSSP